MSGYSPGTSSGGTTGGAGRTTEVGLIKNLPPDEQAVLCGTYCNCERVGAANVRGHVRRQWCVQMRLDALNAQSMALTGVPTKYRPEQPYNMKANPPIPMMDDEAPLEPVSNLRRWINQFWPGGRKEYKAGAGYIRRPDVVIVNDPSQPPNQSNLERVVEMKFFDDGYGPDQEDDYLRIAGQPSKFVPINPGDCECGSKQSKQETSTAREPASQSDRDLDDLFGTERKTGPFGPMLPPPPIPSPAAGGGLL